MRSHETRPEKALFLKMLLGPSLEGADPAIAHGSQPHYVPVESCRRGQGRGDQVVWEQMPVSFKGHQKSCGLKDLPGTWVRSLVGELRSHKLWVGGGGAAKNK